MANQRMQKQKLLEILRLLQQEADNEHPLKCSEIIARLSQKGMSAERKSVYSDIDILRQAGWDIRYQKNQATAETPLHACPAEAAQRRCRFADHSFG